MYTITERIQLRIAEPDDAEDLFNLIDSNRTQMEQFMSWAKDTQKVADERRFLKYCQTRYKEQKLWPATILVDGKIAGMFDFHNIDHDNHHCEIGYWLGKAFQHNGVMTNVVKEATKIGFNELKMHTIQIFAVVDNGPSNRVALNAGFNLEGTLKEYLLANGRYQNSNIYSQMTAKK